MSVPIEKSFRVGVPMQEVWDLLTDPYRVCKCLPGAEITDKIDDTTYGAKMKIKVGPFPASYSGQVRFERLDMAAWTAEIVGTAKQLEGIGGAEMRMTSQLAAGTNGDTEVNVRSDVHVTGIFAQFGKGVILQISDYLFEKFTAAVAEELESSGS